MIMLSYKNKNCQHFVRFFLIIKRFLTIDALSEAKLACKGEADDHTYCAEQAKHAKFVRIILLLLLPHFS